MKSISLLVVLACVLSVLAIGAVAAEPAVVVAEDFSESAGVFGGYVNVADGVATLNSNQFFMLDMPAESLLASNNYEVTFDMKWNAGTVLYFHLVGLNGNDNTNLYLRVEANGQYWSIHDFYGHSIYNNSGTHTGALDWSGVDLTTFAQVKVVHYNGYIELWVNGSRRFVSHLSNFGNNQYSTRTEITEGAITGFAFHAENADAVVIDNFTVKEAVGNNDTYTQTNTNNEGYSILPLSALDLDRESFYVEATYQINNDEASGYYPTIALYGMNASLVNQNGKEYSINCQCYMDGLYVTPQIFAQTETVDWVGATDAPAFTREAGQTLVLRVEVDGDSIKFIANGQVQYDTTFEALGITRGHLQYIQLRSGDHATWTNVEYGDLVQNDPSDSPNTGDPIMMVALIGMFSVASAACLLRRKEQN